jgi:hypothetical protein
MSQPPEPKGSCPRCGAITQPHQEYCLECGERLPREPDGLFANLAHAEGWVWPALLFLAVTIVATAASVAAAPGGKGSPSTLVATQPVTVGPGTVTTQPPPDTSTAPVTPPPTLTTGPLPTAPGETGTTAATTPRPPTTTTAAPAPTGGLVAWPSGRSGWTDVLESIPASAGRSAALDRARAARRAGLAQAGVLLSSDFSSLHPGYYVVFSGIYASSNEATSALAGAQAHGFSGAYTARVSP